MTNEQSIPSPSGDAEPSEATIDKLPSEIKNETSLDITPTWTALMGPMVQVLKNQSANKGAKKEIEAELFRLASIVDNFNTKAKK